MTDTGIVFAGQGESRDFCANEAQVASFSTAGRSTSAKPSLPLARLGCKVTGTDLSWPMLYAGRLRVEQEHLRDHVSLVLAPMNRIPVQDRSFDLLIAHGIWNLARSAAEFRKALEEAAYWTRRFRCRRPLAP
jgi:hypothetical protein